MGREPLHLGALLRHSQGRWNRHGEYACLYTSLSPQGARAEWARMKAAAGSAVGSRELVSIEVVVEPVCDLTERAIYESLASRASVRPHPDFLVALDAVPLSHCQALADQARSEGFTALLVPSAAAKGECNLVIYWDVVAPKHVQLDNGPNREALV